MTRRQRVPKLHDVDLGEANRVAFVAAWVVVRKAARGLVWLFARRGDGSPRWTTNPHDALLFDLEPDACTVAAEVDGETRVAPPPEGI